MAADTVNTGHDVRTEGGTMRFDDFSQSGIAGQAVFCGVGGLIHAAVGLAGGTGGSLTKRSGFFWNAWSRVA